MNYLSQLQAFRDYQMFETKLSSGQIALWHALMQINNKCAWIEWFTAANQTLETLSGSSRSAINKNRNVLKQLGLIDFRSNGKKATSYKVCVLYTSNSTQGSVQQSTQQRVQESTQRSAQDSGTLTKQNETKQNINKTTTVVDRAPKSIIEFYEKNGFGLLPPFTLQKISMWIDDFKEAGSKEPEQLIIKALEIAIENNVRKFVYAESILKDWEKNKILTVKDVEAIKVARESKPKPQQRRIIQKETLPDWANDDYVAPAVTGGPSKEELQRQLDEFNKTSPKGE